MLFVLIGARFAAAQQPADESANASVHLGPLALNPSLQLSNLGVDTNVFNTVENPQRDVTMTLEPQTSAWLHLGRGLLSARLGLGVVYFQKFVDQRAINTDDEVRLDLPLNRFRPYVLEHYTNAQQRPTQEIDARARYRDNATTAGIDLGVFSQAAIGVYGRRDQLTYVPDQEFFGYDLARTLNHTETAAGLHVTDQLTPFTTVIVTGEVAQDRFPLSSDRNSRSVQGMLGVQLSPEALINGNATIGYQSFDIPGARVTGYRGLTATAGLGYVLLGRTKFGVQATRQVQYSFDANTPYYVLTGVSGSISQELFGPVSLVVNGSDDQLAYRASTGAPVFLSRTDTVQSYGGGISYRVSPTLNISFIADQSLRTSPADFEQFRGLRFGMSVVYGKQ